MKTDNTRSIDNNPSPSLLYYPTRGEPSCTKYVEIFMPECLGENKEKEKKEKEQLKFDVKGKAEEVTGMDVVVELLATREREEEDMCSVFSTMEDFEVEGKVMVECPGEENLSLNHELVVVEEDAMALDSAYDLEIEELIQMSLEGVNISAHVEDYCS